MRDKLRKFHALSWQQQKLLLQAYLLLGLMRAAILAFSFKRLTKSLQQQCDPPPRIALSDKQISQAKLIGYAVVTAAAYTPWDSNCLTQALTAQRMLSQQNIAGMFFLGVKKNKNSTEGHAWLQCDSRILTGEFEHEYYTVMTTFSWG